MNHKNYIAGKWIDSEHYKKNINPSDLSDIIGEYPQANSSDLNQALNTAKEAQLIWRKTGLEKKQSVLQKIGEELISRSEEIGTLLSREEGKPLAEGIGEVYRSGQFFTYYAAETLRQIGDFADSVRPHVEIEVIREPVGVVAVISPWNFPVATASWKIAPALTFGNAVIWKPAENTPASAIALTEIISRQEIPPGLFNLVIGSGSTIGQELAESKLVDAITFTGSVEIGKNLLLTASKNMTKIQMEMGSKNALLVMDDADLEAAVTATVGGAFGGTGQKCTASSRLIVHRKIHDSFVERLISSTKNLQVGHALEKETKIGPVVSEKQLNSNLNYLKIGKEEGAHLAYGGERLSLKTEGYYMQPAIFTDTHNKMTINQEEMFAPITCVIPVDSYEEGLAAVKDTKFGLTSGIFTRSLGLATHFKRNASTGCVMINLPTAGTDYHVPFGGKGISSYGSREQGSYAKEFYTSVKTIYSFAGLPV